MHAVNNLLGFQLLCPEDLERACTVMLEERAAAGGLEHGECTASHVRPGGDYSSELLAWTLRNLHVLFGADAPQYELLLGSLSPEESRYHAHDVVGALQHRAGAHHWVALRKEPDGRTWLLDSLHQPRLLPPEQLTAEFARPGTRTFAVREEGREEARA